MKNERNNNMRKRNYVLAERFDSRILGKGVTFKNDSRQNGGLNSNVLIIGGSGSGKTGSYIYSNLKMLNNQSAVVCDTKGLLYSAFKNELEKKGYNVSAINLVKPERSTCGWNPLDYLYDDNGSVSQREIVRFSQSLIPNTYKENEPVWCEGAQGIWQFITAYCLEALPKEDHTIGTLISLYHTLIKPLGLNTFYDYISENPESFCANKFAEIQANSKAEKMFASYTGFINNMCNSLALPELKPIFENDETLDIREIGKSKQVVFITVPDTDHSLDSVCNLFYSQVIQQLILEADSNTDGCLKIPTTIYMDDAGNYNIPSLDMVISISRSRQLGISLLIQSCNQLYSSYGKDNATTIIDNMDSIVYMGGNNVDTAEFIGLKANKTISNIVNMPRDKVYVLVSGRSAILADKIPPYSFDLDDEADSGYLNL